ncbi:MAG TPA: hypothetical protein VNO81_05195 [Candidatus Nitrosotenuis sp.]|nr:hypothetical protein [Candidatus Nitrosotenuis sp.]
MKALGDPEEAGRHGAAHLAVDETALRRTYVPLSYDDHPRQAA